MEKYLFSIVIPTHNRNKALVVLLDSILACEHLEHLFEIIVVSNFPDDEVQKICQEQTKVQIVYGCSDRKSANSARRIGLALCKTDWVYFLDDDCKVIQKNHFQSIFNFLKQYPTIDGLGGPYLSPRNLDFWKSAYNMRLNGWLDRWRNGSEAWQLLGGNALYRTRKLLEIDAFNSAQAFGIVEAELNTKLINSGSRLRYEQQLGVEHWVDGNTTTFFRRAWLQGRNFRKMVEAGIYFPKHFPKELQNRKIEKGSGFIRVAIEMYLIFFKVGFWCQKFLKH